MEKDRKWINLSYIAGTALVAWVFNKFMMLGMSALRIANPRVLGLDQLPISMLISFAIVSTAAFFYLRQEKVDLFSQEVLQELKKVTWPARKDTYLSTMVVIISVMIVAVILGLFDWVCGHLIGFLLKV